MFEHFGCEVLESKHLPYRLRIALGDDLFFLDRVRNHSVPPCAIVWCFAVGDYIVIVQVCNEGCV